jgi:hypothetical protein
MNANRQPSIDERETTRPKRHVLGATDADSETSGRSTANQTTVGVGRPGTQEALRSSEPEVCKRELWTKCWVSLDYCTHISASDEPTSVTIAH